MNTTRPSILLLLLLIISCRPDISDTDYYTLSKSELADKIKGAWAAQTIGVTYGGPTEFRYNKKMIPDSIEISWKDTTLVYGMKNWPGLYDDIYMDLTFVDVMVREGIDAPASSHAKAYAEAGFWLWHANQQGRYNILSGIDPPASGHWLNNPHADDIDFQIEADFAGIMCPGLPQSAVNICDKVGHIMNSGDGYYGGVFVATMYSYAFVMTEIPNIISQALSFIPRESTFYQCISDVVKWYTEYPEDWKKNWELIEEKWGWDIGCPDGAFRDFNIDAKINAAYVVLGLLYGEGDLGQTMEIATRAGQDSDCNPATAGGILATTFGYKNIPNEWIHGLAEVENLNFSHTSISLNDVYKISLNHALEMIENTGGKLAGETIHIRKQIVKVIPLEQNFPGYSLAENIDIDDTYTDNSKSFIIEFKGVGIVLRGQLKNKNYPDTYALINNEETLNRYVLNVNFFLDSELQKTMHLPLFFIERSHEIFFQYEIPYGKHQLTMKILNPHPDIYMEIDNAVVFKKN